MIVNETLNKNEKDIYFKWELELSNGKIGKQILIDDNVTNYIITKQGEVYNVNTERMLKSFVGKKCPYKAVNIQLGKRGKYKTKTIHRLIAMGFIPNPNNYPVINHIDGNKNNNSIDNLEWCSFSDNTNHAIKTGLQKITILTPEQSSLTKHTKLEAENVCKLLSKGYSPKALKRLFDIDYDFANKIYRRKTWKELSKEYDFTKVLRYSKYFSLEEIDKIDKLLTINFTVKNICDYMNWEYNELIRGRIRGIIKKIKKYHEHEDLLKPI